MFLTWPLLVKTQGPHCQPNLIKVIIMQINYICIKSIIIMKWLTIIYSFLELSWVIN